MEPPTPAPRPLPVFIFGVMAGLIFIFQAGGFVTALLGIRHRISSLATTSFMLNPVWLLDPSQQVILQVAAAVSIAAGTLLILLAWSSFRTPQRVGIYSGLIFIASMVTVVVPGFSLGAFLGSLVGLIGLTSPKRSRRRRI